MDTAGTLERPLVKGWKMPDLTPVREWLSRAAPAQARPHGSQVAGWDEASLNLELLFCTDVLKLDSLHYGYWEPGEAQDLEGVRRAQARYTSTLVDSIPADVKTVLDVGCGIGDVAAALADRGYAVTGLSPDDNHVRYFGADRPGVEFIHTRFEDFEPQRQFDLVLMSETQNYFGLEAGLDKTRQSLRPGGYLLVSGMFGKSRARTFDGCHVEGEYIRHARSLGLALGRREDITANILPTLEYCYQCYHELIMPSMRVMRRYLGAGTDAKLRLLGLVFGREMRQIDRVQQFYEQRFNPYLFKLHMKYLRLLFQLPAEAEVPAGGEHE